MSITLTVKNAGDANLFQEINTTAQQIRRYAAGVQNEAATIVEQLDQGNWSGSGLSSDFTNLGIAQAKLQMLMGLVSSTATCEDGGRKKIIVPLEAMLAGDHVRIDIQD